MAENDNIQALIQILANADADAREAAAEARELIERAAVYLEWAAETITTPGVPASLINRIADLRDEVLRIRDVLSLAYSEEVHDGD